ncbi:MAG: hypothetical protein QOI73_864 [Solirubrobacteraceae bacterium]|nr:hypothetical protein [Solirubrobacteraceae bacterium]
MSTITAPAEIEVPRDLLPTLRENVRLGLEMLADSLSHAVCNHEPIDDICHELELALAAHRAFAHDADAYPADAVCFAVRYTIQDARSRIAEDHVSVDEAELLVGRIRACEALQTAESLVTA